MFPEQLTIQLRRRQLKDIYGNDVIYSGINPQSLSATPGTVDSTWYDFTPDVTGLDELGKAITLTWSAERTDDGGFATVGSYAPKKSVSGTMTFTGAAHKFIKEHLILDVAGALNEIEVQITDTHCNVVYSGYRIRVQQVQWCEFNALCEYNISLQQIDEYINCIQRTLITDNWQGWFQTVPANGKKHPRFSYCIERRPNFVLVLEWFLTIIIAFIYGVVYTVLYPIFIIIDLLVTAINGLITVINSTIIAAINALISIVGGTPIGDIPLIPDPFPSGVPTPGDVFEAWINLMLEAAGCGREHPAPLIRDYITNVCDKCGIAVTADTVPVFFNPFLTLTHSDGIEYTEPNPYYNACYYFPQTKRGIRRFRKFSPFTGVSDPNTTDFYIPENGPVLALSDFLDQLNKPFNQQWKVSIDNATGLPTLYMYRKDIFNETPPIYDFSAAGADRPLIIQGICYDQMDVTYPAACGKLYNDDPANKCGTESNIFYNGRQQISFNNTTINPLFKGVLEKESGFAGVKFNCDGASTNYIYDALQVTYSMAGIAPVTLILGGELITWVERYANYAILQQTETITLPGIVIWDGDTDNPGDPNYLNARAMRDKVAIAGTVYTLGKSAWPGTVPGIAPPLVNTRYPTQREPTPAEALTLAVPATISDPTLWVDNHQPQTDVIGRIFGTIPDGVYEVRNIVGGALGSAAAILVNYPMYFEPHYIGTLWDRFHWIDDPFRNPRLNKAWRLRIPLCCEDVKKLGLDTTNGQQLLRSVLLDTEYYNKGIITEITADYNSGNDASTDNVGQTIEIKGIV